MKSTRRRLLLSGAAIAPAVIMTSSLQAAKTGTGQLAAPVAGSFTNAAGLGSVTGSLLVSQFNVVNNALTAVGQIVVTVRDALGNVLGTITQNITLPAQVAQASCTVLELHLGPLDLSLLGLNVHLDQVNLIITANPAGGLLGQLLCALAGRNSLQQLVTLLNQLLALFPVI